MLQKKICMLGLYGVGKTSLVRRYVHSIFSEKYHSTIGVKIDKRIVEIDGQEMKLILWDVAGEEEHFRIPPSYVAGSAGNLLVIDGTRKSTLEAAMDIQERLQIADRPLVVLLNKADLVEDWEIDESDLVFLQSRNWPILRTSAKTGEGVEEAFLSLACALLAD